MHKATPTEAGSFERVSEEEAETCPGGQGTLEDRGVTDQAGGSEGRGTVSGQDERFRLGSLD